MPVDADDEIVWEDPQNGVRYDIEKAIEEAYGSIVYFQTNDAPFVDDPSEWVDFG
jgi:hypothetical protein